MGDVKFMSLILKHSFFKSYWLRISLLVCTVLLFSGQTLKQSLVNYSDSKAKSLAFIDKEKIKSKTATRKKIYKVGELLSLDLAILNLSGEPIFFPNAPTTRIIVDVFDANNNYAGPFYYETMLGDTSRSFSKVYPNEIFTETINLLVGCEESDKLMNRKVEILQATELNKVDKRGIKLLEENAFVSMGEGCLKISKPGNYKVSVKIENKNKLVLTETKERTFVGKIELDDLFITISNKD